MLRSASSSVLGWIAAATAIGAVAIARDARACGGGMFYSSADQQTVNVAAHDVVVSISKTRTVLWDRLTYAGAPEDFAWIMPVQPGAKLEVAAAAWIETLVGGTAPRIIPPDVYCGDGSSSGGCCGSARSTGGAGGGGGGGGVTVLHHEVVGPYDTVTIAANMPGALGQWLADNGYAVPPAVQPILDDYAAQGLEFLAVKLLPDKGVQDMKPLRVIMAGGLTTFPMRMLTAGTRDHLPISLVVLAEGRYQAKGFSNVTIDPATLSWDFTAGSSDYTARRSAALAGNGGAVWLTSFADDGGLLGYGSGEDFWLSDAEVSPVLGQLYFGRGYLNGETTAPCDATIARLAGLADSGSEIVALCADTTMPCSQLMPGQIDAATLACAELTDLSTALVGMHPRDVWVTRLEADLPVAALAQDLTLTPAPMATQSSLSHVPQAGEYTGSPCGEGALALRAPPGPRRAAASTTLMLLGLGLAIARKRAGRRERY
jgi:hypothetical protein